MKKIIVIVLLYVCFTAFTSPVAALNCPYDKLSKLKLIANNIQYDYSYIEQGETISFNIRFTNMRPDIIIYSISENKNYYYNGNSDFTITGLKSDNTYAFIIKPSDGLSGKNVYYIKEVVNGQTVIKQYTSNLPYECSNTDLLGFSIKTPYYNKYYNSDICKKYTENKNCYKWYKHNMNYETLEKKIITEESKKQINNEEQNKNKEILIIDIIMKNLPFIIGGGLLFGISIIYLIKNKNSSKFEGW